MLNLVANGSSLGYQIARSLRIRLSASAYLTRTFSTAQTDSKKITISFWIKRGSAIGSATNQTILTGYNGTSPGASGVSIQNDQMIFGFGNNAAGNDAALWSTAVLRDPAAWYHVVCVGDSTLATATDRMKMYINGVQITSFTSSNPPNLNLPCQIGFNNGNNRIGCRWNLGSEFFEGYLAEFYVIDGQALTPSSFGEFDSITGVWKPKQYTGTYGNNGYYLNFNDNSAATATTIGKDSSGNGNNWTPNNISVTAGATYDSMIDSPTMGASGTQPTGNYAVMNPLASNHTYTNGNLTVSGTQNQCAPASIGVSSGKWYLEARVITSSIDLFAVGFINETVNPRTTAYPGASTGSVGYISSGIYHNEGTSVSNGTTYTTGDVLGVALDCATGRIWYAKNGVWLGSGNPATNTSPGQTLSASTWFFACRTYNGTVDYNFGQRPFVYTPPTGFQALCTSNLPDSTIKAGNKQMDVVLRTSNTSGSTISSLGFKPDFIWDKPRSISGFHGLTDSVRGGSKYLESNATLAEITDAQWITSFNSNGYTIGTSDWTTGTSMVDWCWKGGGTAVSNTSGTITSQVSANTSAGFSIVTWTGTGAFDATVGHGLGIAPKVVISKSRSVADNWFVMHQSTTADYFLLLNSTAAQASIAGNANGAVSTTTTSTTFTCKKGTTSSNNTNQNGVTYVAYCFSEVQGFSKFGSYTGNGSTDGPFVYLGFRPKFVMTKQTNTISDWNMFDAGRNLFNATNNILAADLSNAEFSNDTNNPVDFLSNGFKLRGSNAGTNASGGTYIYIAFAENPFKNSLAR